MTAREEQARMTDGPAMMDAVRLATARLVTEGGWEEAVPEVLRAVGKASGVSMTCLYRNVPDVGGRPGARLARCWSLDGHTGRDALSWAEDGLQEWPPRLKDGGTIGVRCGGSALVDGWGAQALAAVGIFSRVEWWGVLLFAAEEERQWTRGEVSFLRTIAGLLGAAIRHREGEGERRLHTMAVESAGECFVITDAAGRIRYANPAFERITGYSREEVFGRNIRLLESGEHAPEFYGEFWRALADGERWSGRFINRRKDGTLYQQDTSFVPVEDAGGRVAHFVGVGRDVTQEVSLEAQLRRAQKLESLGLLASGIAHDFNNVMSLVLGAAERLKERGPDAGTQKRYLDMILEAVRRGQGVSRRMLAFYRDRDSKSEDFGICSLLEELAEVGRHTFPRNIEIAVRCADARNVVRADRSQIHQALMNLCVNAVGAMPDGGKLTLVCRPASADEPVAHLKKPVGKYVCVSITDSGTGMGSETVERIFDPYFTTKATGEGTGLGLPIVFAIVKSQGGWVVVESTPGRGSVFTIGLPIGWVEAKKRPDEEIEKIPDGNGEGILIVDDEDGIRELLREALESSGYRVLEADDGSTALDVFLMKQKDIDVVVTDLGMAEMGGAELIRRLKSVDDHIPIVVTTGYMDPRLPERLEKAGVHAVLPKPFHMSEVLLALAGALGK